MLNEQKEQLRKKIYNTICYACDIEPSKFSPEILLNYGEYEQQGECADDLTYEHIPEALGMLSSYELPFVNNIYFRDSCNPVTLVINLFKPEKDTRPPLTAKHYANLILSLYEAYLKEQAQEENRIATLINEMPHEKREHFQKKLFILLMRTLSIKEQDFSPDIMINEGIYKLSGRKAERFIHQSALCLQLPPHEVYNHFQERKYFDLPMSIIGWIMIILFSPIVLFAITITSIIICLSFILNCCTFITTGKRKESAQKEETKHKSITANEYVYEMLGLWAAKNAKNIDPFLSSSHL